MKIGIDLGGSHIAVGLVNDNYEIIQKKSYYMSENNSNSYENYIIESIVKGINEILLNEKLEMNQISAIGIATPGNPKDGCINNLFNLKIEKFNIVEELRKSFGENTLTVPIILENDGKCAGIAEKYKGNLKDYDDCVFICIGTGIGGAAFINNQFLKPKRNSGFEFGHMIIHKNGEQCNCGNKGCFEAYCSKRKFKEKMQEILGIQGYICARDLTKKINENMENEKVRILLDEYIDNLTIGISNIINILEPEAISIGGSMSSYEELIINRLKEKINNGKYLFNKDNPPKILTAKCGNDAGIIGAVIATNMNEM